MRKRSLSSNSTQLSPLCSTAGPRWLPTAHGHRSGTRYRVVYMRLPRSPSSPAPFPHWIHMCVLYTCSLFPPWKQEHPSHFPRFHILGWVDWWGWSDREVQDGRGIWIHIADSRHRKAETNTTLKSTYIPIKVEIK